MRPSPEKFSIQAGIKMADGASPNDLVLVADLASGTSPLLVDAARVAMMTLPEPQRLALTIEMVLAVTDTSSRLQLRRLITAANRVSLELGAKALERGEL
jgi:hypothetical protein